MTDELAMKQCPYCAETIMAKAIVCKHCRSSLAGMPSASTTTMTHPVAAVNIDGNGLAIQNKGDDAYAATFDKRKALEECIAAYHAQYMAIHPLNPKNEKKGLLKLAMSLFADKHAATAIYVGTGITSDVLASYPAVARGMEKPLLAVNKITLSPFSRTGILITTNNIHYCLRQDGLLAVKGKADAVNINNVASIALGGQGGQLGSAYEGHLFLLNDQKLGLLRLGADVACNDNVLEYLNGLFDQLTRSVFSR